MKRTMNKGKKINLVILILIGIFTVQGLAAEPLIETNSIDAGLLGFYPLGSYGNYTEAGFGAETGVTIIFPAIDGLTADFSASWSWVVPETARISSLQDIMLDIGAGYNISLDNLINGFSLTPRLSYGWICHLTSGDIELNGTDSVKAYSDQHIMFEIEKALRLNETFGLYLAPRYVLFIENNRQIENQGHEAGLSLGSRFYL